MFSNKRSFFERLTGTTNVDQDYEDSEQVAVQPTRGTAPAAGKGKSGAPSQWEDEEADVGELALDVYETPDNIFIKAMVAGVKPEDLDISITRDSIAVRGRREEARTVSDENYVLRELYWGDFSRSLSLPAEVIPEEAEAFEKHGLLILRLPKIDKERQTKLRVKAG